MKDIRTSVFAVKTSSNCFTTSGGEMGSISAPSIEMGTLTAASSSNFISKLINWDRTINLLSLIMQRSLILLDRYKFLEYLMQKSYPCNRPQWQMKDDTRQQHGESYHTLQVQPQPWLRKEHRIQCQCTDLIYHMSHWLQKFAKSKGKKENKKTHLPNRSLQPQLRKHLYSSKLQLMVLQLHMPWSINRETF